MSGDVMEDVMLPMTAKEIDLHRTARRLRKDIADRAWLDWDTYQDARNQLATAFASFEVRHDGNRHTSMGTVSRWWADAIRNAIGDDKALTVALLELVIANGGRPVSPSDARAVSAMPGAMTPAMSPALVAV